jgi:hypothetical protein
MGALPFLPHPPKFEQEAFPGQSSSSSLQLSGDTGNVHDEAEQSDDIKEFLNLSGDASDGSFHGENHAFAFAEQMEFQYLSEQLGIAITDNEESPQLDVSSLPLLRLFFCNIRVKNLIIPDLICCFSGHIQHAGATNVITSSIILLQSKCAESRISG